MRPYFLALLFIAAYPLSVHAAEFNTASEALTHRTGLFSKRALTTQTKDAVRRYWDQGQDRFRIDAFDALAAKDAAQVGDILLDLSVVLWATESQSSRTALEEWVAKTCAADWGVKRADRQYAGLIFGLAVAYDWHGAGWNKELKIKARDLLAARTKAIFDASNLRLTEWGHSHWHYRTWMNYSAMLAAGLALWKDLPEASFWARTGADRIELILSLLPKDGSHHEGPTYSVIGTTWLTRAASLLDSVKPNVIKNSAYLMNYAQYFEALSVDTTFTTFFDVADAYRTMKLSPAEIFVRLSQVWPGTLSGALARRYLDETKPAPSIFWAVYGEPAGGLALSDKTPKYFPEQGLYAEKYYSGDRDIETFVFKSGYPGGKNARQLAAKKAGAKLTIKHEHPDQNHFVYAVEGRVIIGDTGRREKKWTADHNTLLVGWAGQTGEGREAMGDEAAKGPLVPGAGLDEKAVYRTEDLTLVSADAAAFYPSSLGLKRYDRYILWLKGTGLLVLDDVICNFPTQIQFNFHGDRDLKTGPGGVKVLYPSDAELITKAEGGFRLTSNFKMRAAEDQQVAFVSAKDVKVVHSSAENAHRLEVDAQQAYEIYFRRDSFKPMMIGKLAVDAPLAIVMKSALDPDSQEWIVYRASSVMSGDKAVWMGEAGNIRFGYNAKLGLSSEVK